MPKVRRQSWVQTMSKEYQQLETFQLTRPCPINMEGLDPTQKENFCKSCEKTVYNLSVLSSDAAEALLNDKGRKACIMFVRTNDGRIVTDNCPEWLRPLRRVFRMSVAIISITAIWLATCHSAIAQGLIGAGTCGRSKTQGIQQAPILFDERTIWISGLSLAVAWCTWIALLMKSKSENKGEQVDLFNAFAYLTIMVIVIFAPCMLQYPVGPAYSYDLGVKHYMLTFAPALALFITFWLSLKKQIKTFSVETFAAGLALLAISSSIAVLPYFPQISAEQYQFFSQETVLLTFAVAVASFIDDLRTKREQLSIETVIPKIIIPPAIAFVWGQALMDTTWLVPAVVGLSSLAVFFRARLLGIFAGLLYAPAFVRLVPFLLFGGSSSNSVDTSSILKDFGYDSMRDLIRCSVALALAFALAVIWYHKLQKKKLSARTLVFLLSVPWIIHLVGTFCINNFGGLGGGGL